MKEYLIFAAVRLLAGWVHVLRLILLCMPVVTISAAIA